MTFLYFLQAAILGIVEGLTEFLPVSSTGHLILTGHIMRFQENGGTDSFYVAIQSGAILAVCWHYRIRIIAILRNLFRRSPEQRLAMNVIIAFLPAAVLGFFFASTIKAVLFNAQNVAIALIVGGILILWIENYHIKRNIQPRVPEMMDMTALDALKVGCMQCFALIPGTSRSGATIIGSLVMGLSRKAATEFSFFLAMPTIFGATVYELFKIRDTLAIDSLPGLSVGFVMSFISAMIVVRWLLRYVSQHNFKVFGWYRIIFGSLILLALNLNLI